METAIRRMKVTIHVQMKLKTKDRAISEAVPRQNHERRRNLMSILQYQNYIHKLISLPPLSSGICISTEQFQIVITSLSMPISTPS